MKVAEIVDRIIELMDKDGVSDAEMGRRIGVTRQSVGKWKKSKQISMESFINIIQEYPHWDANWILTGKKKSITLDDISHLPEINEELFQIEDKSKEIINLARSLLERLAPKITEKED